MLPRAEMIVVTTPALSAQKVAVRAANMGRKNYLRIVGVIENMSEFVTPDGRATPSSAPAGARRWPTSSACRCSDRSPSRPLSPTAATRGEPSALGEGPASAEINRIADLLVTEVVPPIDMGTCTVRLMEAPVSITSRS